MHAPSASSVLGWLIPMALLALVVAGCSRYDECGAATPELSPGETTRVRVSERADGRISGFAVNGRIYGYEPARLASAPPPNGAVLRAGVVRRVGDRLQLELETGRVVTVEQFVCD